MSDNPKEAEREMEKAIFISADCWLEVFVLLPRFQLGLGIALISRRFDYFVDEHFKTRKWTLNRITISEIRIESICTKEMKIVNSDREALPIPQNPLPNKVIAFRRIQIDFINRNVIAFLHHFRPIFASCPIYFNFFHRFRKFVPSTLNEYCPSLRFVTSRVVDLFTEFPPDDSANASDGQALAKWLFTPYPNNVPKVFKCHFHISKLDWLSKIAAFKAEFANASSPVNFIVVIWFYLSYFPDPGVVPFDQANEFTREQLALKTTKFSSCFLLVRCPIARDESKWTKWEKEAFGWHHHNQWNQISIPISMHHEIGDGLLNVTPGPSDQQK
ncbi:hypothetical protein niasHT_037819 [Heterodera trifolii]|uniref:F-box domain-containing protein n=1 Tax=Heterodera trifolii TaxID=157864 RepID=A0ABD2IXF3_9BILA